MWDQLRYDVAARRYSAALAFPDLSTFSQHHSKAGHKPHRSVDGPGRYKLKGLPLEIAEKLRLQNLVAVRIADIMNMFMVHQLPFLIGVDSIRPERVSVAHLDEYRSLTNAQEVFTTKCVHCPFGGLPADLKRCRTPSWIQYRIDVSDLQAECNHKMHTWFSSKDGTAVVANLKPSTIDGESWSDDPEYPRASTPSVWQPKDYKVEPSRHYPELMSRYVVSKIMLAIYAIKPGKTSTLVPDSSPGTHQPIDSKLLASASQRIPHGVTDSTASTLPTRRKRPTV